MERVRRLLQTNAVLRLLCRLGLKRVYLNVLSEMCGQNRFYRKYGFIYEGAFRKYFRRRRVKGSVVVQHAFGGVFCGAGGARMIEKMKKYQFLFEELVKGDFKRNTSARCWEFCGACCHRCLRCSP